MKLYGSHLSGPTRTIRYILGKLEVEHEFKYTEAHRDTRRKDFLQNVSKLGKIPVLDVEGTKIIESSAISRYICNVYDKDEMFFPKSDLKMRAKVEAFLDYNGNTLVPTFRDAYYKIAIGPQMYFIPPPSDSFKYELMEPVHDILKYLDGLLSEHQYLISDQMTIADIQIYNEITNLCGFLEINVDEYENITNWRKTIAQDDLIFKLDKEHYNKLITLEPPHIFEVTLWSNYGSQPGRTVLYALKKLGVRFKNLTCDIPEVTRSEEFKKQVNEKGLIPVIDHHGTKITESATICRYLCEVFDNDEILMPKSDKLAYAKVDSLLDLNNTTIRPSINHVLEQIIVYPALLKTPTPDEQTKVEMMEKTHSGLQMIEDMLSENIYLTGDMMTIADVQIFNEVYNAVNFGLVTLEEYTHITQWMEKIMQDPVIQEIDIQAQKVFKEFQQMKGTE